MGKAWAGCRGLFPPLSSLDSLLRFVWVQEEEDAALAAHVGGVDAAAHTGKCEDSLRMCRLVCLRVCPAACASMRECWHLISTHFLAGSMRRRQRERPRGPGT